MFTGEEREFIKNDPDFYRFLKTMSRDELSAFREIVSYICDLSPDERKMFFARVDEALADMGEPAVRPFSEMAQERIDQSASDLLLLDPDYLDSCFARYQAGDEKVLDEVRSVIAEKKMENMVTKDTVVVGVKDNE